MPSSARALTVFVVSHNDSQTLATTVERVYRALTITVEDFAIVIFDDGSTDGTGAVADEASRRYPFTTTRRNPHRLGPGRCAVQGSLDAATNYAVAVPANNTWPQRSLIELFGHVGKADVIASYSEILLAARSLPRRMLSRAYTLVLNLLSRREIHSYHGLVIYPVEYLRRAPIRAQGYGIHAEALLRAVAGGYSFLQIVLPVDESGVLRARSTTLADAFDAGLTVVRLFPEFLIPRRTRSLRRASIPRAPATPPRSGLRIVITGASSGIGASLAQAFARDGHKLFICARRTDRLSAVASSAAGIDAHACDVSDERQVAAFAAALAAKVDAVDVLINCAGDMGEIGPVAETDSERWWRTIEINLKGAYLVTRHLLPLLKKGRQARILNLAGGGAFTPFPNYSAYACSKTALVRLTECLAEELAASDIRVNALAPGPVPTEMHKATLAAGEKRAGRLQYQRTVAVLQNTGSSMDNVVQCVRTLLSPQLDELTGKTISANFDPWQTKVFLDCLPDIARSDLYTLRRMNLVNLPEGWLRETLSRSWGEGMPDE